MTFTRVLLEFLAEHGIQYDTAYHTIHVGDTTLWAGSEAIMIQKDRPRQPPEVLAEIPWEDPACFDKLLAAMKTLA